MKYYLHRSMGFVEDYFGNIGPKVRTNIFRYYLMKILGYRVTKEKEKCYVRNDEVEETIRLRIKNNDRN